MVRCADFNIDILEDNQLEKQVHSLYISKWSRLRQELLIILKLVMMISLC